MHVEHEAADAEFAGELGDFLFEDIGEEEAGLDGALAQTGGAGLIDAHFHDGAHALTGDLHQAELAQRQDVVAGAVALHVFYHAFVELLAVLGEVHVDEVHDDDAAHIAQAQLSCEFIGSAEVDFECVGLLPICILGAVAAVDIDNVQGLGVFDDEVSAVLVADGLTERGLDLSCHVEIVEDGQLALVQFDNLGHLRCYELDVVVDFVVDAGIVDVDVLIGGIEEVAQECYGAAGLLIAEAGQVFGFLGACDGIFPALQQHHELAVQLCHALALGHRAHDDAEVLGLDLLDELFEACTLGAGLDLGADVYLVCEGHEHQEAAGEGDLTRQAGTLRGDGLLDDLYEKLLAQLQGVLHAAFLGQFGLNRGLGDGEEVLLVAAYLLEILGK